MWILTNVSEGGSPLTTNLDTGNTLFIKQKEDGTCFIVLTVTGVQPGERAIGKYPNRQEADKAWKYLMQKIGAQELVGPSPTTVTKVRAS